MELSDGAFRAGVVAGGIVLVLGLTSVRFCGSVDMPAKPPAPNTTHGKDGQLLTQSSATATVYLDFVARDAAAAGVRAPTLDELKRKLAYRADEARHVLEVGQAPIALAGLELSVAQLGNTIVMEIQNTTGADLAYRVVTTPTPNISGCNLARALPFNAMVIAKGARESRVECAYRSGMSIAVTRVETVELPPLSVWYLTQVPPALVGIEDRIGRGHRPPETKERCVAMMSQALKRGIETGEIGWRDLVDFYARHRCQTYQFPLSYRAITEDGARAIPAASSGM